MLRNIKDIKINNQLIKKNTSFKIKFKMNKVHLVQVNPLTKNFVSGGIYIIINQKHYKSNYFQELFKEEL